MSYQLALLSPAVPTRVLYLREGDHGGRVAPEPLGPQLAEEGVADLRSTSRDKERSYSYYTSGSRAAWEIREEGKDGGGAWSGERDRERDRDRDREGGL